MIDIRLPEEILEAIPSSKEEMVRYLLPFVDVAIDDYEKGLRLRVRGVMGGPLDKHEKSILRDFMLYRLMRNVQDDVNAHPPLLHETPG